MTWNGSGTFEPPNGPEFPAVPDDLIRASYYNLVIQALCDAFLNVVPRDGQAPLTGHMDAGGYRINNLGKALANGQAVRFEELAALQAQVNSMTLSVEPMVQLKQGII